MLPLPFLGAFAKLRRVTYYFRYVRPPIWNNSAVIGRNFMKFEYFSEICRDNSSSIKSDNNNRYVTWTMYVYIVSRSFRCRVRNVLDQSYRESQNINFMFDIFSPKIVPFIRHCGKIWYPPGHATDDKYNTVHVNCMPDN